MAEVWKTTALPHWAYFGQRLVDLADIPAGACVLDIGSGRGTSLFPAAQAAGPQGLVVGIEIWDEHVRGMGLEIARGGLHNARVMWMDATALGFRENSFDLVLSGFAYVFFSLQDVFPLLRDGGRVALSSWAWQEDSEWMGELVGRLLPEDAAECEGEPVTGGLGQRPRVYARDTPQTLEAKLAAAGFSDVRILREDKEFLFRDEEEWWSVMGRAGWQPHLETVERLGAGVLQRLKKDAFDMLQGHKDADGIHYTRSVLFALATKAKQDHLLESPS